MDFNNISQAADAPDSRTAKKWVVMSCFLAAISGQVYLLRGLLLSGSDVPLPGVYYIEIIFCALMLAGIVICLVHPLGWGGKPGCSIALVLFGCYLIFSILNYKTFSAAYLTGIRSPYTSTGSALLGFKLALALVGVTAGIPVAPRIDNREYAHRMRDKFHQQEAEWAKASARSAQEELKRSVEKLKNSLTEEQLARLLRETHNGQKEENHDQL